MSAAVTPVSGAGAKGPACFLVESAGARLLLDLGYGPQPGLWPDVSGVGRVDALLLSHGHADHAGGLKLLSQVGHPPVYATAIVRAPLPGSIETQLLPLQGTAEVCGIRVSTGRNGHAPGGVWLHLSIAGGLLYTGDYGLESSVYAYDPPPCADTVILDASYGDYDVPLDRCAAALDRVLDGGPTLLPVPPSGRGPEIALHLARSGRGLPHLDDAMRKALQNLCAAARSSVKNEVVAEIEEIARKAPEIGKPEGVMLAAAADAASGKAASLVSEWEARSTPAIVFTGYLPPGTPAHRLTRTGRALYARWNVHPRLSDNAKLVRETRARRVLPAFGEARHQAAWQAAFAHARVALEGAAPL
ncbi:MAG: MBL fold metallo-hydrolase [Burkholderiales bacterium]